MNSAFLVQRVWNYCNVLRDDGMSYGDYVEQLTYLLYKFSISPTLGSSERLSLLREFSGCVVLLVGRG